MSEVLPMVRRLQADAQETEVPVSALLRRAKVIATKLGQEDALRWIDAELNGYMRLKISDLPTYRILSGQPRAYDPYQGWVTIHFPDAGHAHEFSKAYMGQSIGAIEQDLETRSGQAMFPYPAEIKEMLRKATGQTTEFGIFLTEGQIWEIVETVRNLVLNWSLELEKAGVLGANMTFSEEERREAAPVTHQFFIQNVGVLGEVKGAAQVSNYQVATGDLDLGAVAALLAQAKATISTLPSEVQTKLRPVFQSLEAEGQKPEPDHSRLRGLLQSARTIAGSAAGNVVGSGIVSLITKILGG